MLDAGLTWRQVVLLRAYARYLRQAGTRFSQNYLQRVLRSNPAITRLLVRLFESRFDPVWQDGAEERCTAIGEELRGSLDDVVSLDHDRILRSYLALIEATLRTNYFQLMGDGERAPYLVLKLAPSGCRACPRRGPSSRSSCTRRGSRRSTCASARSLAVVCAGPSGPRTSAPRCSAWSRRRR